MKREVICQVHGESPFCRLELRTADIASGNEHITTRQTQVLNSAGLKEIFRRAT